MLYLLAILAAYLIGSIPNGVVVVRIARGFDVRRIGSLRSGATNVMRAAGPFAGGVVLLLDVLKGMGTVWLGRSAAEGARLARWWVDLTGQAVDWPFGDLSVLAVWIPLFCALAGIAGHNWPIYIRFQGGRGVATAVGTLFTLTPVVAGAAFLVGVAVIGLTRYVSLGSIIGAATIPLGMLLQKWWSGLPWSTLFYGVLVAGLVIFQHGDNIRRLRAGEERRLGDPVRTHQEEEDDSS